MEQLLSNWRKCLNSNLRPLSFYRNYLQHNPCTSWPLSNSFPLVASPQRDLYKASLISLSKSGGDKFLFFRLLCNHFHEPSTFFELATTKSHEGFFLSNLFTQAKLPVTEVMLLSCFPPSKVSRGISDKQEKWSFPSYSNF